MQRRKKMLRREIMKLLFTTIASVAIAWVAGTADTRPPETSVVLAHLQGGR